MNLVIDFYAMKCRGCGSWQVKSTRKGLRDYVMKCLYCNRSLRVYDGRLGGLRVKFRGPFPLCETARAVMVEERKREFLGI